MRITLREAKGRLSRTMNLVRICSELAKGSFVHSETDTDYDPECVFGILFFKCKKKENLICVQIFSGMDSEIELTIS